MLPHRRRADTVALTGAVDDLLERLATGDIAGTREAVAAFAAENDERLPAEVLYHLAESQAAPDADTMHLHLLNARDRIEPQIA